MNDKRKYPRQRCNIQVKFKFYEGNPDDININDAAALKGKGVIMDISKGGAFVVSTSRVSIDMPINLNFKMQKNDFEIQGIIVRTGLIKNNPSEVAQRWADEKVKGDTYIAIMFDQPVEIEV